MSECPMRMSPAGGKKWWDSLMAARVNGHLFSKFGLAFLSGGAALMSVPKTRSCSLQTLARNFGCAQKVEVVK
jgi:hypothetical protein